MASLPLVQYSLEVEPGQRRVDPFKLQLLKWIGNKQRFAHEIASYFPSQYGRYFEPFLGSGAVLGTFAPERAVASDSFGPLIDIWRTLKSDPELVKQWYADRWELMAASSKVEAYESVKASYNCNPNAADLLFLSRSCYGGVVRFRKQDGYMSTPCGVHSPVSPASFSHRIDVWKERVKGATFIQSDFAEAMQMAEAGDIIYCDPPYVHSQTILYGAQEFSLERLYSEIRDCKERGVFVVLSIDGSKRSGSLLCDVKIPEGLFEREVFVKVGGSMLRRFQVAGETVDGEHVRDRLLLTF